MYDLERRGYIYYLFVTYSGLHISKFSSFFKKLHFNEINFNHNILNKIDFRWHNVFV